MFLFPRVPALLPSQSPDSSPAKVETLLAREQPLKGRCAGVGFILTLVIHVAGGDEGRKPKNDDSAAVGHQFPGDH